MQLDLQGQPSGDRIGAARIQCPREATAENYELIWWQLEPE